MMGTLIESRAPLQRHGMGSAVSVVVHAALIGSAIIATAASSSIITTRLPDPMVSLVLVAAPAREKPTPAPSVKNAISTVPEMPSISVPMIIPAEIPAIDLTAVPTATDFTDQRSHGGHPCFALCPGGSASADSVQPEWAPTQAIMQLREPPVPPRYPEALRRAGVDGAVVVKFVVDTLGRVDLTSIEVLSSSHDLFTAAVRETLTRLRFNPAKIGDRKVRAAAIMPFHFTLK